MPDIDLDFPDRTKILDLIKHVPAAIETNGIFKKDIYEKKHYSGNLINELAVKFTDLEDFLKIRQFLEHRTQDAEQSENLVVGPRNKTTQLSLIN